MKSYFVFIDGKFKYMELGELAEVIGLPKNIKFSEYSNEIEDIHIWSARLSTGLFGLTSCRSGNRGPKNYKEVILGVNDYGLRRIVELGFIPCPVCKPETIEGFWEKIDDIVIEKYGISTLEKFLDKDVLGFDARRVKWEDILPVIGDTPNRIYLPRDLSIDELLEFRKRFENIGFELPVVGYYDPSSPKRFREYIF